MVTLTLSDIIDDLRLAEDGMHRFERRYWISSTAFYDLYSRGLLDDGEHTEEFAEWAGHYKLMQKRQSALEELSNQRLDALSREPESEIVRLVPAEPALQVG